MPTRTRRAAAKKQQQYRISDDEDEGSEKGFGDVLASLSHNVPQVHSSKSKKNRIKPNANSDGVSKESTPPRPSKKNTKRKTSLPSSVIIGKTLPSFSPPTQAYSKRTDDASISLEDGVSAMSCDFASPVPKSHPTAGNNSRADSEDEAYDDDNTVPMEGSHKDEDESEILSNDPNETLLEHDDEDDYESEDELDEEEDLYSQGDFEDEQSESEVEEEEFDGEDDEYVPDDDDDESDSEDDLEDYDFVEKEKPTKSKKVQKKSKSNMARGKKMGVSKHIQSPASTKRIDTDSTAIEETPSKSVSSDKKLMGMASPESIVAVVVDDDNDDEEDILVATIIDDDQSVARIDENQIEEKKSLSVEEPKSVKASEDANTPSKESAHASPTRRLDGKKKQFYRQEGIVKRGKWSLGAKIGVGSFGVVHVGMNTRTGTLMAVKRFTMSRAVMKDVRREVELMRSLDHKNIVRYFGAQMDQTYLHIFQEWVPGGSVASLLSRFGPFSMEVIRSYLSQTLAGLAYLHENNIMHRDMKGSNLLVNDEGTVKLADFGASKKLANLQENMMMSLTVRGTPYFMAPEVFEEKYSAKADIWGVGCVAFQMATASPPWKDKGFTNPISLFNFIKKHEGPPPMVIREEEPSSNKDKRLLRLLEDLVEKCFQHNPDMRPTVHELQEEMFFFAEMQDEADDESHYRGLFSPGSETIAFFENTRSPGMPSHATNVASPQKISNVSAQPARSKSVIQWKTSFLSPPRQKRNSEVTSPSPIRPSPQTVASRQDSSEWPEWARDELKKQNLFGKSPGPRQPEQSLSELMGSLALSEDSNASGQNPFRSSASRGRTSTIGTTANSNLIGLKILDKSPSTFEI